MSITGDETQLLLLLLCGLRDITQEMRVRLTRRLTATYGQLPVRQSMNQLIRLTRGRV